MPSARLTASLPHAQVSVCVKLRLSRPSLAAPRIQRPGGFTGSLAYRCISTLNFFNASEAASATKPSSPINGKMLPVCGSAAGVA